MIMKPAQSALHFVLPVVIRPRVRTLNLRILTLHGLVIFSVSFFALTNCLWLTAQNVVLTGSLSGRVTDQTSAVVPGASVEVQNLATGVKLLAETNHAGLYHFPSIVPGTYSIRANRVGFLGVEALVRAATRNQTCYLVPNSGPGNFGTLQEVSPNGLPRALQFSARFTF